MNNKGQAALEFLTTYGWMLLIVVAVLGVMLYYGLGDARSAIPSSCYIGDGFECGATFAHVDGHFAFEFTNNAGEDINISKVRCVFPGSINLTKELTSVVRVNSSQKAVVMCSSPPDISPAEKDKFSAQIVYESADESDPLTKILDVEIIVGVVDDNMLANKYKQASDDLGLFING